MEFDKYAYNDSFAFLRHCTLPKNKPKTFVY